MTTKHKNHHCIYSQINKNLALLYGYNTKIFKKFDGNNNNDNGLNCSGYLDLRCFYEEENNIKKKEMKKEKQDFVVEL